MKEFNYSMFSWGNPIYCLVLEYFREDFEYDTIVPIFKHIRLSDD